MGGISVWHLLLFFVILILVFGPARLSGLGRGMADAIKGFKKGLKDDEIDVTDSIKKKEMSQKDDERS